MTGEKRVPRKGKFIKKDRCNVQYLANNAQGLCGKKAQGKGRRDENEK